jgi:hypothetical protein
LIGFASIAVIATVDTRHAIAHLAKRTLIAISAASLAFAFHADRLGAADRIVDTRNNALRRTADAGWAALII